MDWLIELFGSSKSVGKTIETAAEGIYNGFDKLVFTDEEKSDVGIKKWELFSKFATMAYDQNSIRSVTRRWLAFIVVGPDMLCFLLSIAIYPLNPEISEYYYKMFLSLIPWAGGVLAFYFGPHFLSIKSK